ncbi:hypothetical protein Pmani_036501 [Petrolisthes manimaculis]|uniref:TGF-beta family profile domain-containing protein n=1 Tax=Petrolisthes manimaculis TaxID=1843537 RepID=A0AAE1TMC7_9EUCA|nr:hypothetical protein Pmani_036501 [Petrolisthes manimaculis]
MGKHERVHSEGKQCVTCRELTERSDSNSNTGTSSSDTERKEGRDKTRIHQLVFNVTLPRGERVVNATLRLYTLITRDQYTYIGVQRRVRLVMEVQQGFSIQDISPPHDQHPTGQHGGPVDEGGEGGNVVVTVSQRDVYEHHNAWETFDVTYAVRYWLSHPTAPQVLQIYIESVFSTVGDGGDMDVATAPLTDSEPLLLLYTTVRKRKQDRQELDLMIYHEYDDEEEELKKRRRRRRRSTSTSTQEESTRERRSVAELAEEESNAIWDGEVGGQSLPRHAHNSLGGRGPGRRGRKRRAKNGCKKKPLKVDFKDIGWDRWIIAPPSYEANQCSGKCFYPLASHLSPTKHAVVQNLVHSLHPDRTSRACCVPTLLGPISLLYIENGITTYKYDYDDMVVLECGCR